MLLGGISPGLWGILRRHTYFMARRQKGAVTNQRHWSPIPREPGHRQSLAEAGTLSYAFWPFGAASGHGRLKARYGASGYVFQRAATGHIPFEDGVFAVVMSTFGVAFAPNQDKAAADLFRMCRPGGKIALASWGSGDFIAEIFRVSAIYAPPPPGL